MNQLNWYIGFHMNPNHLLCEQLLYHSMARSDIDRQVRKPSVKYKSLSAKTSNNFLHRAVHIYNTLPDNIRFLPKKSFSKQSKAHIKSNFATKNIPKIND